MNIWLINHYAVPPQYYPLVRPSNFAKNLMHIGHHVTIIAASTVHNSAVNLIEGHEKYRSEIVDGVPYVYIRCSTYQGNGVKRIANIIEFACRFPVICRKLEQPDVIIATSFDPLSCWQGIRYAKKHKLRAIAEIADLWPETLLAYGMAGKYNPIVLALRRLEKSIYKKSDTIIFTMEGAYHYIEEQGWEKDIPQKKVKYINNGVDLEQFESNLHNYRITDADLEDSESFKVVYTGSIRKANKIDLLVNAARELQNKNIRILVWGDGDQLEQLESNKKENRIDNIIFKGRVQKECIPYILSKSDVLFLDPFDERVSKYGISSNKMFEYLAAGKPILMNQIPKYNPVAKYGCDIVYDMSSKGIARAIETAFNLDKDSYQTICKHARQTAQEYAYNTLTDKLSNILIRG